MTVGLQLLRSIVEVGAQTTLRQCYPVWFTAEELPIYQFMVDHASRHGRMPTLETMREAGVPLPRATEPVPYYLDRVRSRAIFTQLEQLHPDFLNSVRSRDMDGALSTLRQMLANTTAVNPTRDLTNIVEQGQKILEDYEIAHRSFQLLGVPLGWDCVDDVTDGGHAGDVIVLVGRPNVGKTMALLWMLKRAWMMGKSILLCSMEMQADQITRRVIGIQSGLNPQGIRSGRLSTWGRDMMRTTVQSFDDMAPFNIITGNFRKRVSDINRAAEEQQPDLIVVDAGYLVTPDKKGGQKSRREVIADVIEELKGVAIDRQRPLLTSVQFNREVKKVQRGDLDLASIGETDVIAQVGTVVLGMRYGDTPYETTRRRFELIKNRDGRLFKFETNFSFAPPDLSFSRFIVDEQEGDAAATAPDNRSMI